MKDLNERQAAIVDSVGHNLIVSASPGSGKTTTIVARANKRLSEIKKRQRIALITYTNAAADEILSRVNETNQLFIGTIHAFCLEFILKSFGWTCKFPPAKVVSYEQRKAFFEQNPDIILNSKFGQNRFKELSKIRHDLNGNLLTDTEWEHAISLEVVAERYRVFLTSESVIEFEDILLRSYTILKNHNFIRSSLSKLFGEIMIDEFQDTDLFQYQIMKMIHDAGDCKFVFVGDEKQRIFGFAGAIDNAFENAINDFSATKMNLNQVYRSTNAIVNCYCKLFSDHPEVTNLSKNRELVEGSILFFETKKANYNQRLLALLRELINENGINPNEIAILSNSWFDSHNTSKIIREEFPVCGQGALPHISVSNSTYQLFRSVIRFTTSPTIAKMRIVRRNFANHCLENNLVFDDKNSHRKINNLIFLISEIDSDSSLSESLPRLGNIFDAVLNIHHSVFDEILELIQVDELDSWDYGKYKIAINNNTGIRNDTIHKVKGLEFDIVILNNMNENRIPRQKLLSRENWEYEELKDKDIADARTVFYVACSRPRLKLIVNHNWKPSMFVNEIR